MWDPAPHETDSRIALTGLGGTSPGLAGIPFPILDRQGILEPRLLRQARGQELQSYAQHCPPRHLVRQADYHRNEKDLIVPHEVSHLPTMAGLTGLSSLHIFTALKPSNLE